MKRFIVFSKSNWDETPRLRHQIAYLLLGRGHDIVFFQKPVFFWQRKKHIFPEDGITLKQTSQLIHHQLRIFKWLSEINALIEVGSIRNSLEGCHIDSDDVVINFNYDYFFLRNIFPDNKIITIINDDFVAQAKLMDGRHIYASLKQTLSQSDATLVVSFPLVRQASAFCKPHLFFPWSDSKYKFIERSKASKSILLWAHLDGRIDFSLLSIAAENLSDFQFYLVGPVAPKNVADVEGIARERDNVHLTGPQKLDSLLLSDFFVSIIPYKKGVGDIEAVTMSNKSLQLMARGLPLVTYGMPDFYEHPGIKKAENPEDFLEYILYFYDNFLSVQKEIAGFVNQNGADQRYQQLMEIVNHG